MSTTQSLDALRQDVALGVRLFARHKLFSVAAVLTLALGVGANSAVFAILKAALLQPLPYHNPSELAMLWRTPEHPPAPPPGTRRPPVRNGILTSPTLVGWRRELSRDVGDIAGLISWQGNTEAQFDLTLESRTERLNGALVTPNFFELLGVRAARGRLFAPADEPTGTPVIVLSDAVWRRDFGADPGLVGRAITLTVGFRPRGPRSFVVAGILPREFRFTYPVETEAWVMMPWSQVQAYEPRAIAFQAVVRVRATVGLERARARARAFFEGINRNVPPERAQVLVLQPMHDWIVGETRPSLLLLGGVALLLFVVTCATVANGLLARASARRQELSIRVALGAGRQRLVRQLITEGALLATTGAAAGVALAAALGPVLRALLPESVPRVGELSIDPTVLAFGVLLAAASTILAALAPAWGGTRFNAAATLLRGAGASSDKAAVGWRQLLVGTQASIATALLISAVLLLTSFWRLARVPLGFDGERVLTVEMRLLDPKYRDGPTLARFEDDLLARVRAVPGIVEAGITSAVPFRGVDFMLNLNRPGSTQDLTANARYVDSSYFSVLRIPLVRGRVITSADREGAPLVIVVSESYARKAFGTEDAVGKQIQFDGPRQVVGVVGDVRYKARESDPYPAVYFSRAQATVTLICLVARTSREATVLAPAIHRTIRELDPAVPALNLTTVDRIIDASVANRRFYTVATASFATIALLLTIGGLAAVVARVVTERRRELAIRAALGATLRHLLARASGGALRAVAAGIVVGALGAYVGSMALAEFLFQVEPRSLATYGGVVTMILAVAAVASLVPVLRIARLPLAATLRSE